MKSINQEINVGSLVESKQKGFQGIVRTIYPDLWSLRPDTPVAFIRELMNIQVPPYTDDLASNERWFEVSDFGYLAFSSPESDLQVIPASQIRFNEFPSAFSGKLIRVTPRAAGLVVQISTDQAYKAYQPSILVIKEPTVTPYVGDSICGTQDLVIISADGLDYPYQKRDNQLVQHWNLFPSTPKTA